MKEVMKEAFFTITQNNLLKRKLLYLQLLPDFNSGIARQNQAELSCKL